MKSFGYFLIAIGFLMGSYLCVRDTGFKLTGEALTNLEKAGAPPVLVEQLEPLRNRTIIGKPAFLERVRENTAGSLTPEQQRLILQTADLSGKTLDWTYFIAALTLGILGVVSVRISTRQLAQAEDKISANLSIIEESLDNLVRKVSQLNADKHRINTYDMRHKIDEQLLGDLDAFAEARETIGHVYGLQAYADVMSHFAGGERYLNRIWSASADGYIDEVNEVLDKAQEQFEEAQKKLQALKSA